MRKRYEHVDLYDEDGIFAEKVNAARLDPARRDRKLRRVCKPRVDPKLDAGPQETAQAVAETTALEAGFDTTYTPSRYEEGWLLNSLRDFFDRQMITDVLAVIKGGKEASVYLCEAGSVTGYELLAAKVYRPRIFRSLRNDHMYRQGRDVLTADKYVVGKEAERVARAIGKKTAYGLQVAHTSWLMYEFTTLEALYADGGAVPEPIAASDNAILMSYHGDEGMAAPMLNTVRLKPGEAGPLFQEVIRNVELLLRRDLVHGDLSAYNILYWEGAITLIDFPQVVNVHGNREAYAILRRDLQRVCEYFAGQGVRCDVDMLLRDLWQRSVGRTPAERDAEEMAFILAELETAAEDW